MARATQVRVGLEKIRQQFGEDREGFQRFMREESWRRNKPTRPADARMECAYCSKAASRPKEFKCCARCQFAHYCYAEHQRLDWPKHKKVCIPPPPLPSVEPPVAGVQVETNAGAVDTRDAPPQGTRPSAGEREVLDRLAASGAQRFVTIDFSRPGRPHKEWVKQPA